MNKNLGKINKLSLRQIFKSESLEFTPWLLEHIDELSETVGIEIVDVHRESGVGDFNCDLIGIEENTEDKIIIENQIEPTNHDHLGKLITYASGVGAKYVIWVSTKIREEHKKALEWLNEQANNISFFGVEVSAIQIDNSAPALDFKLVIDPNEWSKEVKKSIEKIDERHQKYMEFYTRLVSEYEKIKPNWGHLTPRYSSWLGFGAGKAGFRFVWAFRGDNRFNTELYIDTKDKEEVKTYFSELLKYKKEIDWDKLWKQIKRVRSFQGKGSGNLSAFISEDREKRR